MLERHNYGVWRSTAGDEEVPILLPCILGWICMQRHLGATCCGDSAQETCTLEIYNYSVWQPAAEEGENSVCAAGDLHPCLDSHIPRGGSQRHPEAICQGSTLRGAYTLKLNECGVCVQAGEEGED